MDSDELVRLVRARHLAAGGEGARRRMAAGLSLREVADSIGVSHGALWRWERGERTPRGPEAAAWVHLLDQLEGAAGAAA